MALLGEVHVGDVGTEYRARIYDAGETFDPTEATVKKLRFLMPQGLVELNATEELVDDIWYLVAIAPAGFHPQAGPMRIQGYLEFGSTQEYSSNIQTIDIHGATLRVHPNL